MDHRFSHNVHRHQNGKCRFDLHSCVPSHAAVPLSRRGAPTRPAACPVTSPLRRSFLNFDLMHGVAGLLVGAIVGVTGVGGGALMTPILVMLFGIAPTTAVGT